MEAFQLNGKAIMDFDLEKNVHHVIITTPSGEEFEVRAFKTRDYRIHRDEVRFSKPLTKAQNPIYIQARYFPQELGVHKYSAYTTENELVATGEFDVENSKKYQGYIGVSKNDKRYFAYEDGTSFVPIGISMPQSAMYTARDSYMYPHYEIHGKRYCTLGVFEYERIIKKMRENGMNLIKICIGGSIFDARTGESEAYDYGAFAALDLIIDLCRNSNVKVMLTFDIFRSLGSDKDVEDRYIGIRKDPSTGHRFYSAAEYLKTPDFFAEWVKDLRGYVYRYGNDPTIFAFELWDEMDRIKDYNIGDITHFTNMLVMGIRNRVPHTMVTTSLSRYDHPDKLENQKLLSDCGIDFDQLHRCIDTACKHPDCHDEMQIMITSGVNDLKPKNKPLLVSQTGMVNPGTDQSFLGYRWDHTGIVLHDTAFAAFFAGAAGLGFMNETADYVDSQNLWEHYKVFAEMINSLKADKQRFKFEYYRRKYYYMQVMKGRTTTLIYIRSTYENYNRTLLLNQRTIVRRGIRIKCMGGDHARVYPLPGDLEMPKELKVKDGDFWLPGFKHGMILRVR